MRSIASVASAAAVAALAAFVSAAPLVQAQSKNADCFEQLERSRSTEIVCEFPTRLTEQERKDLQRITRKMLQDAACVVSIRVTRDLLDTALGAEDHVFTSPPQPVRCTITTRDKPIEITGTFSPRVVFARGQAVEATPGLADVAGVSSILAWPVVQYVNRSATVRDGMLTVINAYRGYRGRPTTTAGGRS